MRSDQDRHHRGMGRPQSWRYLGRPSSSASMRRRSRRAGPLP